MVTAAPKLREIAAEIEDLDDGDPEASHARGDDLLIEAILALVSSREESDEAARIVSAWRQLHKWYA